MFTLHHRKQSLNRGFGRSAFTLIEIMFVVALIGIVMAIGAPSFTRMMHREGMQKAVADFMEACRLARANAILDGTPQELVIHPKTGEFEVTGRNAFSSTFPRGISIDIMGVNFVEMQNADEARVKFQPTATCDEFAMVITSDDMQSKKITLEVVTGLVDVETLR